MSGHPSPSQEQRSASLLLSVQVESGTSSCLAERSLADTKESEARNGTTQPMYSCAEYTSLEVSEGLISPVAVARQASRLARVRVKNLVVVCQ